MTATVGSVAIQKIDAILERLLQRAGLAALLSTLAVLLWGLWRSTKRPVAPQNDGTPGVLRTPGFYLLASTSYFVVCYRLWRPLPPPLSGPVRLFASALGALLYFPGLALVLWGRLTLAQMYSVSSSFGAQLYANHRLVTHGPFALVRHPIYLGVMLTAVGGLLLYRTATFLFLLAQLPALLVRARREEQALAAAFGEQWEAYCGQAPAWIPSCK